MTRKYRVFIDGQDGTTGLQIYKRLVTHPKIEILNIDKSLRKDVTIRQELMSQADITILCLPDNLARDAVALAKAVNVRIIDASSAHRIEDGWVYGFAELSANQRKNIHNASHVSNPGCYATGAISLLGPLICAGLIKKKREISIHAISGYSGGGKQMIKKYQQLSNSASYAAYGLDFNHKHINEIQLWSGLSSRPIFQPSVGNYAQGMLVFIPLNKTNGKLLHQELVKFYVNELFINVRPINEIDIKTSPYLLPDILNNTNNLEIFVFSNLTMQQTILVARLDNLGKGASGSVVQNLNIMLGLPEDICVNL